MSCRRFKGLSILCLSSLLLFAASCESQAPQPAGEATGTQTPAPGTPEVPEVATNLAPVSRLDIVVKGKTAIAVMQGNFPNSCYSWDRADLSTNEAGEYILKPYVKVAKGMCLMMMSPFQKNQVLGEKIAKGTHKVKLLRKDGSYLEESFKIGKGR